MNDRTLEQGPLIMLFAAVCAMLGPSGGVYAITH